MTSMLGLVAAPHFISTSLIARPGRLCSENMFMADLAYI